MKKYNVSVIFSEHFPYYKSNDDRWKNSVRHNLSINPHFRKGSKAPHGAGHLWAIANRGDFRPHPLIHDLSMRQTVKNNSDESQNNGNIIRYSLMQLFQLRNMQKYFNALLNVGSYFIN